MSFILGESGPCQVKFGGVDLGKTKGGVKFTDEVTKKEITYDQTGDTVQNTYTKGRKTLIEVPLMNTDLSLLQPLIAGSTIDADGLIVMPSTGLSGRAAAKELILTIYENGVPSVDPDKTIVVFVADPLSVIDWGFDADGDRITVIKCNALPDDASGNVGNMWRVGLPTP